MNIIQDIINDIMEKQQEITSNILEKVVKDCMKLHDDSIDEGLSDKMAEEKAVNMFKMTISRYNTNARMLSDDIEHLPDGTIKCKISPSFYFIDLDGLTFKTILEAYEIVTDSR